MKLLLYAASGLLLLGQCTSPETKTVEKEINFEMKTELLDYPMTALDTVYSAKVSLTSSSDTTVFFVATLQYQGVAFRDSLPFTLVGGQTANGQIIFSECPILQGEKPELTSTLKPID